MSFKVDDLVVRKTGLYNKVWKDVVGCDSEYQPKRVTEVIGDTIEMEGLKGFWMSEYFKLYTPSPTTTITLVEEYKQTLIQIEQLQSKAKTLLEEINKASK